MGPTTTNASDQLKLLLDLKQSKRALEEAQRNAHSERLARERAVLELTELQDKLQSQAEQHVKEVEQLNNKITFLYQENKQLRQELATKDSSAISAKVCVHLFNIC